MITKTKYFFVIFSVLFFLNCSPSLNYLGNYETPTQVVSIFFDANEIQNKYKVLGLLNTNFEASILRSTQKSITDLIINKGKEVGADAVLITKFSSDNYQELSEDIMTKKLEPRNSEKIFIEAKFLKYIK